MIEVLRDTLVQVYALVAAFEHTFDEHVLWNFEAENSVDFQVETCEHLVKHFGLAHGARKSVEKESVAFDVFFDSLSDHFDNDVVAD